MNRFGLIAVTLLTFLAAGCASDKPRDPFATSKEDIRAKVKIVAFAPVAVADDMPNGADAKKEFGDLIADELGALGFQTVPAAEFEQIFNRLRDEQGGFFDPNTGKADNEKYKKVQDLCRRELAAKFHADAVLYPAIRIFPVSFGQDTASWDGVKEAVSATGLPGWFLAIGGRYENGTVPAISLCVSLKDIEGNNLYAKCGGIQLAAKSIGGSFRKINDDKLLTDMKRNTNAVAIAFKPLHDEAAAKSN
jgi:outer membrane murein-binding lipoprotein Lpp